MTTISWKSIEHGWAVECSDGETVGKVFLVVGDENADIFDGVAFTHHGGAFVFHNYADRPHYVAADRVASIDPGVVKLSISSEEAAGLPGARRAGERPDRARGRRQGRSPRDLVRGQDRAGSHRVIR